MVASLVEFGYDLALSDGAGTSRGQIDAPGD